MKVNVLQVAGATFPRLSWWPNWVDVCIYDYECAPYLLQMQVSRRNKKRFRNTRISGSIIYRQVRTDVIGDLVQMERDA